jgi:uncharacterized SAM-binding protein YcdF (DUF218 family)
VAGRRSLFFKSASILLLLAVVALLARNAWLPSIGSALVHDDGAAKADIAVVLAGDYWGHRLTKGAELVRQGYVPRVLVSGPPGFYGCNEADAAIRFAVAKGYPAEWFIPLHHNGLSTLEESDAVLDDLKQRKIVSFLLVTSNYHTARARRIYLAAERRRGGGPDLRVVASGDEFFTTANWWRNRESRKTVFLEWTKTLASALGI